jgi:hypothetical protein
VVGRRSAMGPGKPYWKTPFGSTGACTFRGCGNGCGAGGPVGVGEVTVVVVVVTAGEGDCLFEL